MIDLKKVQKDTYKNKIEKGWNTTDISMEFALAYGEIAEAYEAYFKKKGNVGEELADVVIYLAGLAEILKIDLEKEVLKKVAINKKREYKVINGVWTRIKDG